MAAGALSTEAWALAAQAKRAVALSLSWELSCRPNTVKGEEATSFDSKRLQRSEAGVAPGFRTSHVQPVDGSLLLPVERI